MHAYRRHVHRSQSSGGSRQSDRNHTYRPVHAACTGSVMYASCHTPCMTQHSSLISQLRAAGYKVELVPVMIGHSGTTYTSQTLDNMKQLGISTYHARKCALKMHVDAINHLHSIVRTQRHLEPNTISHDSNPKPNPRHQRGSHFKPP